MKLKAIFRFDSASVIDSSKAVQWLQRYPPLPKDIGCIVTAEPELWEAVGAKVLSTGEVQPPSWFAKTCVVPHLADLLLTQGYPATCDDTFSRACIESGVKEFTERYENEQFEKERVALAVVECEEFARGLGGNLKALVQEGYDTRGAVLDWVIEELSRQMETKPLLVTRKIGLLRLRERGSPPPVSLVVLRALRAAIQSLRLCRGFPSSLTLEVTPISRVEVHASMVSDTVPKIWTGVPVQIHVPGIDPMVAVWNADAKHLPALAG